MNTAMITKAKSILSMNRIKKDGENYWKVDGEIVRRIINKGRTTISCTCTNCTKFIGHPVICHRKIAVILYEAQDFKLKKILNDAERHLDDCKKGKMNPEEAMVRCLIIDLRGSV